MIDLSQLFDAYGRQARLYPALLALGPIAAVAAAELPTTLAAGSGSVLLTAAACFGALYLLTELARTCGKRVEPKLLEEWGGWPTTIWLRHASPHLVTATKRRYHQFLTASIPQLSLPDADAEAGDPAAADDAYGSAVDWLRSKFRGNSPLVEKENTSYGFRRNLYGLKPIGLTISLAACAFEALMHVLGISVQSTPFNISLRSDPWPVPHVAALSFAIATTLFWLLVVRSTWVRAAGDAYARALLGCCDQS